MNSEKLLVCGCGDLGRRLAGELAGEHFQITGLRRHPPASDRAPLNYVAADTNDREALTRALAPGFAVIVITMTPGERSDAGYRRAYVDTCHHLVAALDSLDQRPRLIVFVSSTGVYGQHDGEEVDEDSSTEPERFSGRRLLEAERVIADSGHPYTVVRFSGIYGPGRGRLIEQVRSGRAALARHYTNRIHADDCAGFLAHLIRRSGEGEPPAPLYLATDSRPAPKAEVVAWLAARLGTDTARFAPDEPSPRAGNKRCLNHRLLASGYRLKYPSYQEGYAALLESND